MSLLKAIAVLVLQEIITNSLHFIPLNSDLKKL